MTILNLQNLKKNKNKKQAKPPSRYNLLFFVLFYRANATANTPIIPATPPMMVILLPELELPELPGEGDEVALDPDSEAVEVIFEAAEFKAAAASDLISVGSAATYEEIAEEPLVTTDTKSF